MSYVKKPIFPKLSERYNLMQTASNLQLLDLLMPITNVDDILKTPKAQTTSVAADSTGSIIAYTIPTGKRWYIRNAQSTSGVGTTARTTGFWITKSGVSMSVSVVSSTSGAQTLFSQDLVLDAGDTFNVYISTANAGDTMLCRLYYFEQEVY